MLRRLGGPCGPPRTRRGDDWAIAPRNSWDGALLRGSVRATWVHGETAYTANRGITGRHGREILATDPASDEGAR